MKRIKPGQVWLDRGPGHEQVQVMAVSPINGRVYAQRIASSSGGNLGGVVVITPEQLRAAMRPRTGRRYRKPVTAPLKPDSIQRRNLKREQRLWRQIERGQARYGVEPETTPLHSQNGEGGT